MRTLKQFLWYFKAVKREWFAVDVLLRKLRLFFRRRKK